MIDFVVRTKGIIESYDRQGIKADLANATPILNLFV